MDTSEAMKLLDEVRNKGRLKEFKIAYKISAVQLIGPLFPLFAIADYLSYPQNFILFLSLRVSVTLYCGLFYYLVKDSDDLNNLKFKSLLLISYPSIVITFMIIITGDMGSVYFAGLNLIAAGAICFFPWKNYKEVACVTACIFVPYAIVPFFTVFEESFVKSYLVNWFFIVGSVLISYVIRIIYEKLKWNEVLARENLRQEIENRNTIIREKTEAAIRLSSLSKQFSPQIVKSINDGRLNLKSDLYESTLCAIFIDIKDSTKKMLELDSKKIQKVISSYVEDVMGILLKYDITIDKFLGDGVLGFSNNPVKHDDYVERVLRSAFEIIDRLDMKSEYYEKYWGDRFQVRIGISVGTAAVGFYGSEMHVKSYTAIGKVINLAARINGVAPANGIILTEDVMDSLHIRNSDLLSSVTFNPVKQIVLKGFENEHVTLYQVKSLEKNQNLELDMCPHGHGPLYLDNDSKGLYILKCRDCDFVLGNGAPSLDKKSAA